MVTPELYAEAPTAARGAAGTNLVHWLVRPLADGSSLDGAYWALSVAYDRIFGPLLGPALFDQATQVQEWDGTAWRDVA